MRQNLDSGAKELGRNKHLQRRLGKPLGTNKGRDVVVGIRVAFWTLQGGLQLSIHLLPAITSSNPDNEKGNCIRAMVEGAICHVGKDLWMLSNIQAALNGSRLQCHQQGHLQYLHASQHKKVQSHARRSLQQKEMPCR